MKPHNDTSLTIWTFLKESGPQSIDGITAGLSIGKKVAYAALKRMKDAEQIVSFEAENPLYAEGVAFSRPTCTFFEAVPDQKPKPAATKKGKRGKTRSTLERMAKILEKNGYLVKRPGKSIEAAFLSDVHLSERLQVSRQTIWRWVREGSFPKPLKLGDNCTRWRISAIEKWEKTRGES